MKKTIIFILVITIIFGGYACYKYPTQTKRYCNYGINGVIDKVSGTIISICARKQMVAEIHNLKQIYTTNLYEVKYTITNNGYERKVNVTTYGKPNLIRVGNRETLTYYFPDGGLYKITGDYKTRIKILTINKIA